MAKAKKAAKRTTAKKTASKRATTRRASAAPRARKRRAPTRRAAPASQGLFDFNPSGWISTLIGSQTGRVIMAEALVAAAGAAAAVLVASRTERAQRAGKALADGGTLMKEAAVSAASAARDVIGRSASDAIGSAAKSLLGGETQHDLAEKALRLKREHNDDAHDVVENARRARERERPH